MKCISWILPKLDDITKILKRLEEKLGGPEMSTMMKAVFSLVKKVEKIEKKIDRLEERIELIEKNIKVPEEVTQADIDALSAFDGDMIDDYNKRKLERFDE